MILGPAWAFLGVLVAGIAAFALIPGCGLVVVDEAPDSRSLLHAPRLVEIDTAVASLRVATRGLSPARARRQVRSGLLRVRSSSCEGDPTGSGLALDRELLIAHGDVLPGAGSLRVARRGGGAKVRRAVSVYRLGAFGVARVQGRLPRTLPFARRVSLGAAVAVVGYPLSARPRLLRGVVVDRVAGAPFGVRGKVIRLTAVLPKDEPGGPVIDARGRIVGVAFATDPGTGFAVAVPLRTLRSLVARRSLEALPPCGQA